MEKIHIAFKTLSILFLVNFIPCNNGLPQRSIQLGGTGPRPVALGSQPAQTVPSFSQQLAFGPAPTNPQQLQYQQAQQGQQQQGSRVRFQQQQQSQQQQQQQAPPQQIYLQQGPGTTGAFPPIGSFPIPANIRQPVVLRSPVATTTAASEEEYEDEEYSEEQPQPVLVRTQPTQRPTRPAIVSQQRNSVRVTPAAQSGQGSQRFVVPQQQQAAAPAQVRRPIARPTGSSASQEVRQQINTYQPRPALGQDSRLISADGNDRLAPTPEPIKTLNRYMNKNDDGSTSWGYTNEDGSFKEETIGVDCVVRGKYGYVDPDGVKREFEYQTGNPCDPNKRGQQEEEEEDDEVRQPLRLNANAGGRQTAERLGGVLTARPIHQQQPQQLPQFRQAQRFAVQQ